MKTTIKGQSSDVMESIQTAANKVPTNISVESNNVLNNLNARKSELHYRDLTNQTTGDHETLYGAALFGHYTPDQVGKFINDFTTKGFKHAFTVAMETDSWLDVDQTQLCIDIITICSLWLATNTKGNAKQQILLRIKSTADEQFKYTNALTDKQRLGV